MHLTRTLAARDNASEGGRREEERQQRAESRIGRHRRAGQRAVRSEERGITAMAALNISLLRNSDN
jgi:hypothetical protein